MSGQDFHKSAMESAISVTRRKSIASSTIRLSTHEGFNNKSAHRYNGEAESKLSTSLNLNSNRGVTQKEIESALDLKNELISNKP
jgi:hypothetical protein